MRLGRMWRSTETRWAVAVVGNVAATGRVEVLVLVNVAVVDVAVPVVRVVLVIVLGVLRDAGAAARAPTPLTATCARRPATFFAASPMP